MPISTVLPGAASLLRCTVVLLEVSVGHNHTILLLSQEINYHQLIWNRLVKHSVARSQSACPFCAAAAIQLPKLFQMKKIGCGISAEKPFISDNNTVWLHSFKAFSPQWIYFDY